MVGFFVDDKSFFTPSFLELTSFRRWIYRYSYHHSKAKIQRNNQMMFLSHSGSKAQHGTITWRNQLDCSNVPCRSRVHDHLDFDVPIFSISILYPLHLHPCDSVVQSIRLYLCGQSWRLSQRHLLFVSTTIFAALRLFCWPSIINHSSIPFFFERLMDSYSGCSGCGKYCG